MRGKNQPIPASLQVCECLARAVNGRTGQRHKFSRSCGMGICEGPVRLVRRFNEFLHPISYSVPNLAECLLSRLWSAGHNFGVRHGPPEQVPGERINRVSFAWLITHSHRVTKSFPKQRSNLAWPLSGDIDPYLRHDLHRQGTHVCGLSCCAKWNESITP